MSRAVFLLALLAPVAFAGEADILPRPQVGRAHHAIYDHPRAQAQLQRAAATGVPVVEVATEEGTWRKMEYTFHPSGQVTARPVQVQQATYTAPRQEVAGPRAASFPDGGIPWVEGHRCPSCGHESPDGSGTWVIRGGNPSGVHQHQCPRCGQRWQHAR